MIIGKFTPKRALINYTRNDFFRRNNSGRRLRVVEGMSITLKGILYALDEPKHPPKPFLKMFTEGTLGNRVLFVIGFPCVVENP